MTHFYKILTVFSVLVFYCNTSQASISGVSGNIQLIPSPSSVILGALQSDTTIFGFNEVQNYTLTSDLLINGNGAGLHVGTGNAATAFIASGTKINSYLFHVDSVSTDFTRFGGTIFFDRNILAIIFETNELNLSDTMLGATGTHYSTNEPESDFRGFEGDGSATCRGLFDCATISTTLREITLDLGTTTQIDQIRIITSPVPVPASFFLFGSALSGLIGLRYRRRAELESVPHWFIK